jgi:hypothetical protein
MNEYKKNIIPIIKWLAIDLYEVVIDIYLSDEFFFHTIEWRKNTNSVILHKIINNIDYEYDFDDLDLSTQKDIYYFMARSFLN